MVPNAPGTLDKFVTSFDFHFIFKKCGVGWRDTILHSYEFHNQDVLGHSVAPACVSKILTAKYVCTKNSYGEIRMYEKFLRTNTNVRKILTVK
jgi:hypothetical protein